MTMRDQIETGIYNAIGTASPGTFLASLPDTDAQHLVDAVLAALAEAPQDTPAPSLTIAPASTPMLVLSPADVVARYAADALHDVTSNGPIRSGEPIIHESWAAGPDIREVRELLFRIQPLFGVRIRTNAAQATLLVAGTPEQVRAFQRIAMMLRDAADPVVDNMNSDEQKVFYATLGTLIADHEDADGLIEDNRDLFQWATDHLNTVYGLARNLRRATPVSEGALFDAAAQVAPVRLPVN